jgi:hypothetical protein
MNIISKKFFTLDESCVYVEVLNINTSETFLIYIPSKYKLIPNDVNNIYPIINMDIPESGDIPSDYAINSINSMNNDISMDNDIDIDIDVNNTNIEGQLENKYNKKLTLNTDKNDIHQIKEIFRILKRFKLCLENIKYKMCIIYKSFLCSIHRSDTMEGFKISNFTETTDYKIYITIDLESLYEKSNSLESDLRIVKKSIYSILNKNHKRHTKNINTLFTYKDTLILYSENLSAKKTKYESQLEKLHTMLDNLNKSEVSGTKKLELFTNNGYKQQTIDNVLTELEKIKELKKDVIRNIRSITLIYDNLCLNVDKIMFDNIVMLDTVIKNFSSLASMCDDQVGNQ